MDEKQNVDLISPAIILDGCCFAISNVTIEENVRKHGLGLHREAGR
jgi:hypothetical protein